MVCFFSSRRRHTRCSRDWSSDVCSSDLARSGIVLPTPWTQVSGLAFTVWDEVAFGPANLGWPKHEIARQVDRVLEQLELGPLRSEEHTSELQSRLHLVCRLLLEKKKTHRDAR